MNPFYSKELQLLNKHKSLLMVSGGADSVCLFHLFSELKKTNNVQFEVVHFNHNLRGDESDSEELFVVDLCRKAQVSCHVVSLSLGDGKGIQNKSRELRYNKALERLSKIGGRYLVTAHHKDDALETLVLRNERGAGFKGFCGMRRWRSFESHSKVGFKLFRPLLGVAKSEITAWLQSHAWDWREDSSNQSLKYLRNKVRHQKMTGWTKSDDKNRVLNLAKSLQYGDDYFDLRLSYLVRQYGRMVDIKAWDLWTQELQFRYLHHFARLFGYKQEVQANHIEFLKNEFCKFQLGSCWVLKDKQGVYFWPDQEWDQASCEGVVLSFGSVQYAGLWHRLIKSRILAKAPLKFKTRSIYLDSKMIQGDLKITRAKGSELFHPYGKSSAIPIKDYFQSKGVGRYQRLFWPVIKDQVGAIVGVLGIDGARSHGLSESSSDVVEIISLSASSRSEI